MVTKYLVVGDTTSETDFSAIMTADEVFRKVREVGGMCRFDLWKINGYGAALSEMSLVLRDGRLYIVGDGLKIDGGVM